MSEERKRYKDGIPIFYSKENASCVSGSPLKERTREFLQLFQNIIHMHRLLLFFNKRFFVKSAIFFLARKTEEYKLKINNLNQYETKKALRVMEKNCKKVFLNFT